MKIAVSTFFLERPVDNPDWVIYILVLTLAFIVIGRILFSNNYEALTHIERFQDVNDNQALFGLIFQISFAVLSGVILISYVMPDYDYIFHTPIIKVITIAFLILVFFAARYLLGLIAAYAFGITQDRNFTLKTTNYFRVYSVGVLWFAVLLLYFSEILKPVILIVGVVLLIIIRFLTYRYLIKNQQDKQTKTWYYNILYLCALEILPLLVFLKFLKTW